MSDKKIRSIAKTFSWRLLIFIYWMIFGYIFTGSFKIAGINFILNIYHFAKFLQSLGPGTWPESRESVGPLSMLGGLKIMNNRNFKYLLKSISSHILRAKKHSGHLKIIQKVTKDFQKSPKLKF